MAIMAILLKLAIMAWHYMAINMVNVGVSAKNRQNVDSLRKRIEKIASVKKLWPKQNILWKRGQKWPISFVFLSET